MYTVDDVISNNPANEENIQNNRDHGCTGIASRVLLMMVIRQPDGGRISLPSSIPSFQLGFYNKQNTLRKRDELSSILRAML